MKAAFTIASSLVLLSSVALASDPKIDLPAALVIDSCTVSSGTQIPIAETLVTENVRGDNGTCTAIPAGARVIANAMSVLIDMPDGRVVRIQRN